MFNFPIQKTCQTEAKGYKTEIGEGPIRLEMVKKDINKKLMDFKYHYTHPELEAFISHSYSILTSPNAKRVRSLIPILIGNVLELDYDTCVLFGVVIELLHYTSLIHDDVIDDHTERRGYPTLNHKYTKRNAVLIGDYLMCEIVNYSLRFKNRGRIIKLVIDSAKDLVAGLIIEQDLMTKSPSIDHYLKTVHLKTSSLFRLSFGLPFLRDKRFSKAEKCGNHFGLLFQVYDDYHDQYQDKAGVNIYHILSQTEIDELVEFRFRKMMEISRELGIESVMMEMVDYLQKYNYFSNISVA